MHRLGYTVTLHRGRIRTDVHQLGDGASAAILGIFFKQFAHLKEEHHKDSLGELRLGAGQEADQHSAKRSYAHQQMFIEWISFHNALPGFSQDVVTHEQVGRQVDQQ